MERQNFNRLGKGELSFTRLGFGTAPVANLYRALSEEDAQATLQAAWDAGCRYFDTAPLYGLGLAETRLNAFLRGRVRDEYLLSTKVGRLLHACRPEERTGIGKFFDVPSRREEYDYSHDGVMRSFEASLERLGVDRVDILFAHDLDIFTHGSQASLDARRVQFMESGCRALVSLRDQGVIRAFGAGINEWQAGAWLLERCDVDLFLLAGRYTLLEQEALESFLPDCERRGVGIVLGGPFNSGILATGPKPGAFFDYAEAPPAILEKVARIEHVCGRFSTRLAEAALQFPLLHPSVLSVIPGGQSAAQVRDNKAMLDKAIPAALWTELKAAGLMREDAPTARYQAP